MGAIGSLPALRREYSKFSEIIDLDAETYLAEALRFVDNCIFVAVILRRYFLDALQGEVEIVPVILRKLYSIELNHYHEKNLCHDAPSPFLQSLVQDAPLLTIDFELLKKWGVIEVSQYLNEHYYYTIRLDDADCRSLIFTSHIRSHHRYYHLGGLSFMDMASTEKVDFRVSVAEVAREYAENCLHGSKQIFGPGMGVGLGIERFLMFAYYFYYNNMKVSFSGSNEMKNLTH